MASDYYDIMHVSVEQFAYLKCPNKIRAAYINAGGERITLDAVNRGLERLPTKVHGAKVGEPTLSDGVDFRVPGLVKARRVDPRRNRQRQAALPKPEKVKKVEVPDDGTPYQNPTPRLARTDYSDKLIERVCEALDIKAREFFSDGRTQRTVMARALVIKMLRERNHLVYSYPRIAEIVGRNDHSTMIHAYQNFDNYCRKYPAILALYNELQEGGE